MSIPVNKSGNPIIYTLILQNTLSLLMFSLPFLFLWIIDILIVRMIGADLSLSLTGMRIGPRDPTTHAAKVGVKAEVYKPDHTLGSLQARIMKVCKNLLIIKIVNKWLGYQIALYRRGLVSQVDLRSQRSSGRVKLRRRECFLITNKRKIWRLLSKVK